MAGLSRFRTLNTKKDLFSALNFSYAFFLFAYYYVTIGVELHLHKMTA